MADSFSLSREQFEALETLEKSLQPGLNKILRLIHLQGISEELLRKYIFGFLKESYPLCDINQEFKKSIRTEEFKFLLISIFLNI